VQNSSVYAPITFEEIVVVKISVILMSIVTSKTTSSLQPITKKTDNLVNQSNVEEDTCSRHSPPPLKKQWSVPYRTCTFQFTPSKKVSFLYPFYFSHLTLSIVGERKLNFHVFPFSSVWLEVDTSHPEMIDQWINSQHIGLNYSATFKDFAQR